MPAPQKLPDLVGPFRRGMSYNVSVDTIGTIDKIEERLRWTAGILSLISTEPDAQMCVKEAGDCAAAQLGEARRLLRTLAEGDDKSVVPAGAAAD